ncbi:MAG: hypothetical protein QGF21_06540 [Vicinamibacterales bacterium]|nr:hypothetical protein [Vicinamibacterales bacterium]
MVTRGGDTRRTLFVIAFLDSSFLSLPQINDIQVIWMVTQQK